nr:retrovirus-related Pol polyprotein from transposon TNT 1-94 [Tanacetum cinerariifolium]
TFATTLDIERYCRVKKAHIITQGVQQANVSEEDQVDDEYLFMALDIKDNPSVKLGDGRYARAKGKGTIAINTKKGTKYISRVLYVPELDQTSLDMVNDSYYLKLDVANASAFSVTEDASMKWHTRFGHFNYKTLQHMKASVILIFKSFKNPFEVQSGSTLRILRIDNGREYTSNEFDDFLWQQESKGYRCYDLTDSKTAIRKDMTFDEGSYWDCDVFQKL